MGMVHSFVLSEQLDILVPLKEPFAAFMLSKFYSKEYCVNRFLCMCNIWMWKLRYGDMNYSSIEIYHTDDLISGLLI